LNFSFAHFKLIFTDKKTLPYNIQIVAYSGYLDNSRSTMCLTILGDIDRS